MGKAIYVEVLDALLALARARNNQVRSLYSARMAEADLKKINEILEENSIDEILKEKEIVSNDFNIVYKKEK